MVVAASPSSGDSEQGAHCVQKVHDMATGHEAIKKVCICENAACFY